jgi:metal-dependent hydrolase (beta-lactamase superfamily II)
MIEFRCAGTGSSGNAFSITDDGKILLLDAGIDIKSIKKLINWKVGDVVCSFISHEHL